MILEAGLTATKSHTVLQSDLAVHWGGDIPVLASPVLIGLLEETCMQATDASLPDGKTTVGIGFDILHLAPTPEEEDVYLIATLEDVASKQLRFLVEARDARGLIARGTHFRAIVDRLRFLDKIAAR